MESNDLLNKLNSINWNFDYTIEYSNYSIHPFNCRKYYSYPATFIPEIPYALIELLSKKGDVVVDPFGGIGTTFMQALILERKPFSFDINPIANKVCMTLYRLLDPSLDLDRIKAQLLDLSDDYHYKTNYVDLLSDIQKELIPWYEENTLNELSYLIFTENQLLDETMKMIMNLAISSILVSSSSQNKGWAYIADNVKPKEDEYKRKQVIKNYKNTVSTLINDIEEYASRLDDNFENFYEELGKEKRIFTDSILNTKIDKDAVDLIITSPPYPKMIDYVKSQRLSFSFNNELYSDYVINETGARCRRTRKDTIERYRETIKKTNRTMRDVIKAGGYLCIVLPDYDSNDNRKKIIEEIVEDYSNLGFEKISVIGRYIPSHKRTLSIQWATLVNESIYVFRKVSDAI